MSFYVYAYYYTDTNQTFYIGRGSGNRYRSMKRRSSLFLTMCEKYPHDVKIVADELTENESIRMERRLIRQHIENRQPMVNIMSGEREGATRRGIEKARREGKQWGRAPAKWPDGWETVIADVSMKRISNAEAMARLGMKMTTYYKLIRMTQESVGKEPLLWAARQELAQHIMRLAPHGKRAAARTG